MIIQKDDKCAQAAKLEVTNNIRVFKNHYPEKYKRM